MPLPTSKQILEAMHEDTVELIDWEDAIKLAETATDKGLDPDAGRAARQLLALLDEILAA